MSLQVWLPLNGNLDNLGLDPVAMTTNTGATVVNQGKIGKCYSFDATDDWIQGVFDKSKYSGKPMSLACWFKCDKTDAGGVIIDLAADLCLSYSYSSSGIKFNAWRCYTNSSGNRAGSSSNTSTNFSADVWHHAVATFEGGFEKVYVDGALVQTFDHTSLYTYNWTPLLNATTYNKISIGKSAGDSNWSGGMVNDVRIYDHCLSQAEVYEIAKGKMIHLKLDNGGFGQENLLINSHVYVSGTSYNLHDYYFVTGEEPVEGQTYTIQLKGQLGEGKTYFGIYNSGGSVSPVSLYPTDRNSQGIYTKTFTWRTGTAANTFLRVYHMVSSVSATSIIEWIKLEKGSIVTPWVPNHTDADYSAFNLNAQFDCSGYRHDAITNAITHSPDTARHVCSSVFNGSSSYVKVNDTTWMADRMPAMTINVWAKVASSWPTTARIFSCTESGGFNCEAGNSGYWRFPVHVYTSATEASVAYKYDSQEIKLSDLPVGEWVMLTWIYDLTGTKTYINSNLHHTYTNTSYGIHFNTGARLFLGCEANAASPTTPYFNGQMSDFRLYATALSEEDIKILYHTSGFVDNQGNVFAGELREV